MTKREMWASCVLVLAAAVSIAAAVWKQRSYGAVLEYRDGPPTTYTIKDGGVLGISGAATRSDGVSFFGSVTGTMPHGIGGLDYSDGWEPDPLLWADNRTDTIAWSNASDFGEILLAISDGECLRNGARIMICADGRVLLSPELTPDRAAREFWVAVQTVFPRRVLLAVRDDEKCELVPAAWVTICRKGTVLLDPKDPLKDEHFLKALDIINGKK